MVIANVNGRTATVKIVDPENPTRRGKPPQVDGIAVFTYVGATAPEDVSAWKFEANTTRTTFQIEFPVTVAEGAKFWVTAFYFNERKQSGMGATPVSGNVQFGGAMAA